MPVKIQTRTRQKLNLARFSILRLMKVMFKKSNYSGRQDSEVRIQNGLRIGPQQLADLFNQPAQLGNIAVLKVLGENQIVSSKSSNLVAGILILSPEF